MKIRHNITIGVIVVALAFAGVLGLSLYSNTIIQRLGRQQLAAMQVLQMWEAISSSTARLITDQNPMQARAEWDLSIDDFESMLRRLSNELKKPSLFVTKAMREEADLLTNHWQVVKNEIAIIRLNFSACSSLVNDTGGGCSLLEEYSESARHRGLSVPLYQTVYDVRHFEIFSMPFRNLIASLIAGLGETARLGILHIHLTIYFLAGFILIAASLFVSAVRLAESGEKKNELLAEQVHDIIWTMKPDGSFAYISPSIRAVTGFTREEAMDLLLDERLPPESREMARSMLAEELAPRAGPHADQPSIHIIQWQEYRKDRTTFWAEVQAKFIRDPGGRVTEIVGVTRDISRRKEAEDALNAEKERLAVTLSSLAESVISTDRRGRITMVNPAAEHLTGWDSDRAVGRLVQNVFLVVDIDTRCAIENPVDTVLATGKAIVQESNALLIPRDEHPPRHIAFSCAPIRDRYRALIGCVLVFRDITTERRLHEEMHRSAKLESLGVLAGGIAHDFNNLLAGIMNNIGIIKLSAPPDAELAACFNDLDVALKRTRELTGQLLTFARGGAPIKKVVSLHRVLEESLRLVLRGSPHALVFSIAPDLWPAEVDEGQISQVMSNLVINAAQAMDRPGAITVRACNICVLKGGPVPLAPGEYIKADVQDQGAGVPTDLVQKIFDPFFTTKPNGSGLGLASAFSIIKAHSGYLYVESSSSTGTVMTFYLPAQRGKRIEPDTRHMPAVASLSAGAILVMDDEEILRKALSKILSTYGYTVASVSTGEETIDAYRQAMADNKPFDCVILDLTVPGRIGGRETLEELKKIDPDVCAVVSSGYSNDEVMAHFKDFGFAGVLAKPYKLEDLHELIEGIVKKRNAGDQ
jgi:PAS domain S-box-containing protein